MFWEAFILIVCLLDNAMWLQRWVRLLSLCLLTRTWLDDGTTDYILTNLCDQASWGHSVYNLWEADCRKKKLFLLVKRHEIHGIIIDCSKHSERFWFAFYTSAKKIHDWNKYTLMHLLHFNLNEAIYSVCNN